jgi:alpha-mannosidase
MHYVNRDGRVNVFYSNPIIYTKAKNAYNSTWPLKTDDFFPYADISHAYWTGYFTSRPALKRMVRVASSFLQTARQLFVFAANATDDKTAAIATAAASPALVKASKTTRRRLHADDAADDADALQVFAGTVGVAQHHDAVAGTEKQHVAYDYARRLGVGMTHGESVAATALATLLNAAAARKSQHTAAAAAVPAPPLVHCRLLNESRCDVTQGIGSGENRFDVNGEESIASFSALVYNPLAHATAQSVAYPISSSAADIRVYDGDGIAVDFDVTPDDALLPLSTLKSKHGGGGNSGGELQWKSNAKNILRFTVTAPPLGFNTYFVQPASAAPPASASSSASRSIPPPPAPSASQAAGEETVIQSAWYAIAFDVNGMLSSILSKHDGPKTRITQKWLYYDSLQGTPQGRQNSGAYIFRPQSQTPTPLCGADSTAKLTVYRGATYSQVTQTFTGCGNTLQQRVRLFKNPGHPDFDDLSNHVTFDFTVGPVDISSGTGREVVMRFVSDSDSGDEFLTDSNGREMQLRRVNYRPTWKLKVVSTASDVQCFDCIA